MLAIVRSDQLVNPADLVDDGGGLHGFLCCAGLGGYAGRARNTVFACEQADAQHALTHGGSLGPAAAVPLEKN